MHLKNRESQLESEQFVDISPVEERARYSSWKRVSREPEPINSVKLTVLVANLDINTQLNNSQMVIELNLPLIQEDGIFGFDIQAIASKTIAMYDLRLESGIMVDFWSDAYQMYILCDDLFSEVSEQKRLI